MMAGKLNPPNVMIIEKKPHVGGDFGFAYMYMAVFFFLASLS
jgi:hypothetical protein